MEDIGTLKAQLAVSLQRQKELELSLALMPQQLEENAARLKMVMEATQMGTWEYKPQADELTWSDQCRRIYGVSPDVKITFNLFANLIHEDDRAFVEQEIQKSMHATASGHYDITFRIYRFDNRQIRWIRSQGQVYFKQGQAEHFIGTIIDITDSRLEQEESARLAAIIESSDDAIISKTLDGIITTWNKSATRVFGYMEDEMIGEPILKLIPEDRHEEELFILSKLRNGERIDHFETKRLNKEGKLLDISLTVSPIRDNKGNIIGVSKIARDITEIKLAEEKNAKLAAIIDSSDDAIISKTLDGIITSWNNSAVRTFGYTAEEMIGQSILRLIPIDRQEEEPQILSRLRKGERVEHFETKRITKTGQLLDVSLTISPVVNTHGQIIGLSKIARDISERKEEELRKNDFIAMVSHELKTPLTSMKSYLQVLLSIAGKKGDEFTINALTRADIQAKKMTTMIQDFLSLARLEEGKISLHKEKFVLHPVIEETANDAQYLSTNHKIVLKDCEGITLYADRDKIGQVLMNLLSNAIKYSPKGTAITIGCEKQPGKVKIYVQDEGVGINLTDQKRLFERFYRSKNEKTKTVSGFGIGLYLVSEILSYHKSKIEVESEEGVGSIFYFSLNTQ